MGRILAIDYDDWSIENCMENIARNHCNKIILEQADSFSVTQKCDIIVANINKNVILNNLSSLASTLVTDGKLLLSGLLLDDESDIKIACIEQGLKYVHTVEKNNWICLLFKKMSKL